jgi:exosortase H (IPTLxxWG-CTERM-specific)
VSRESRRRAGGSTRPVLTFLLKCIALWALAILLVSRVPEIERRGVDLTIGTIVSVLRPFDRQVERTGNLIHTSRTVIEIVPDCSPHMPFLIFAAVVLAFPASWRQRALGLALGALVIHVFNVIRIITLIGILGWKRSWFEFAHVYLWQTGTILIVFLTFALWIRMLARRRPAPA